MSNQHLASRHRTALRAVFQHPIAHNLEWRAVVGLLGALGSIEEHDDGKLAVEVNGEHLVLQRPKHKDVTDALVWRPGNSFRYRRRVARVVSAAAVQVRRGAARLLVRRPGLGRPKRAAREVQGTDGTPH